MSLRSIITNWNHRRLQIRLKGKQAAMARFWDKAIRDYYAGRLPKYRIEPKQDLGSETIIWQYWGQGFSGDQPPVVVKYCLETVERYRGDCRVIHLSDDTISDYIDLPDFIWEGLRDNPSLTRTFFSDLLRLALLEAYGGVWLDSTILLTRELPRRYLDMDFFAYQLPDDQPDKDFWSKTLWAVCCWDEDFLVRYHSAVLFAHRGSEIISTLLDLMLYYWSDPERRVTYYHFFHVLFYELVQVGPLRDQNCPIETYTDMESLMQVARGRWRDDFETPAELLSRIPIHKLTFKFPEVNDRLLTILSENQAIRLSK